MKIVHICLANSVWDESYAYQDNLLPSYHKRMGHGVTIFAPTSARFDGEGGYIVKDAGVKILADGVKLIRVKPLIPNYRINNHIHLFHSIYKQLVEEAPDLIFVHDPSILNNLCLVKYKRKHPNVKIVFDNHSDLINSDQNIISKFRDYVFARFVVVNRMINIGEIFYGTTPSRNQYLADVFKVPDNKIKLLVMGADDDKMNFSQRVAIRTEIRNKYGINDCEFLVVTGGKIDDKKNVHLLAQAISEIEDKRLRLLIFGSINEPVRKILEQIGDDRVVMAGWVPSDKVYNYMYAADMVAFPGLHSVLWEQAVASRVPCAFSKLEGFEHININGNAILFENQTVECYKEVLRRVLNDEKYYAQLKLNADTDRADMFLYSRIAQQVVDDVFA